MPPFKNIHVIANPAAGGDTPVIAVLNRVFRETGIRWDLRITHDDGDGATLARAAVEEGADLVLAYGGDGTVMDVVNGMYETDVPFGILPGGTGNAAAGALNLPGSLERAAAFYALDQGHTAHVDLGMVNGKVFLLRADVGQTADLIDEAHNRELKDQYGAIVYYWAVLRALATVENVPFKLTIDGVQHESEGAACMVANLNNIGSFNLRIDAGITPQDGVLDVFVINKTLQSVASLVASLTNMADFKKFCTYYTGVDIKIESEVPLPVMLDGEDAGETPLSVKALPSALKLYIPKP